MDKSIDIGLNKIHQNISFWPQFWSKNDIVTWLGHKASTTVKKTKQKKNKNKNKKPAPSNYYTKGGYSNFVIMLLSFYLILRPTVQTIQFQILRPFFRYQNLNLMGYKVGMILSILLHTFKGAWSFLRIEFFIQMICHHPRNLYFKFQLNQSNHLDKSRDDVYCNRLYLNV